MQLGMFVLPPGPGISISQHMCGRQASWAPLPSSPPGPGEHTGLGSTGHEMRAHLIPSEDGQWLSHGLSVGQDEVQHAISIEVGHHAPCRQCRFYLWPRPADPGGGRLPARYSNHSPEGGRQRKGAALGQEDRASGSSLPCLTASSEQESQHGTSLPGPACGMSRWVRVTHTLVLLFWFE